MGTIENVSNTVWASPGNTTKSKTGKGKPWFSWSQQKLSEMCQNHNFSWNYQSSHLRSQALLEKSATEAHAATGGLGEEGQHMHCSCESEVEEGPIQTRRKMMPQHRTLISTYFLSCHSSPGNTEPRILMFVDRRKKNLPKNPPSPVARDLTVPLCYHDKWDGRKHCCAWIRTWISTLFLSLMAFSSL